MYAKLGYFSNFNDMLSGLRRYLEDCSFDLTEELSTWLARGCFMHSSNHPKPYVIADMARFSMTRAEIPITADPEPEAILDTFVHLPRISVYPEIAERLGFEGSLEFFNSVTTLGLSEFVDRSYEIYARLPRHALVCRAAEDAIQLLEL